MDIKPYTMPDGEFKGWQSWREEIFEFETAGPFFFRREEDGNYVSAFRAERKHLNAGGVLHGGCLMSFGDFALFAIAADHFRENYGATVAFNSEFIAAAGEGALIEARGEVIRAGSSIVFVRGIITADGDPVLNFSGTLKKFRKRD